MNKSFENFLFTKHILVSDHGENQVEAMYALLNQLNIRITEGFELANIDLVKYATDQLGQYVPEPFYRGFPQSVRKLTADEYLFDQVVSYIRTYGFGDFDIVSHSIMEDAVERSEFAEQKLEPHDFVIMTESAAEKKFYEFMDAICESTRPQNAETVELLVEAWLGKPFDPEEDKWFPKNVASKQLACDLLLKTRDYRFARFLQANDVIKLLETIQHDDYNSKHLNKLHLINKDRKLFTKVLDITLQKVTPAILDMCLEKRAIWKGLLHHLHYVPKCNLGRDFVVTIFDDKTYSTMSVVEGLVQKDCPNNAACYLQRHKGDQALLRNLNWLLQNSADAGILTYLNSPSPLVLMQLIQSYKNYNPGLRTFRFTKYGGVVTHRETERKNHLSPKQIEYVSDALNEQLIKALRGRFDGKVYIAPGMERVAVPINMSAGESGFGIMPTGSRIKLPEGKKIRAFTYWEKVNDIDLACFGIDKDGRQTEFSWRTMYYQNSDAVTYSGDETSGYNGGSEYFDIDIDAIRKKYPEMTHMVFTNNVYSGINFEKCVCRAGWMSRDILDSGAVYEPKTVRSAYTINAKTTFAYLYAIDLQTREVIWLNLADERRATVAGATEFGWIRDYFSLTDTMNVAKLFRLMATEVVDDPAEADLVVGDVETEKPVIRSYDFEKIYEYLR